MSFPSGKTTSNIALIDFFLLLVDEAEEQFFSDSYQGIIDWTNQMDNYYVDLMLEQVCSGNKTGSTFTDHAWASMVASFNKTFGLACDKDLLESRYLSLMNEYNDVRHMVDHKNVTRGGIHQSMATDGEVCEMRIKVPVYLPVPLMINGFPERLSDGLIIASN